MDTKNAVWWINHLCNDFKEYARARGYTKQANEVEEAQTMAVKALKEVKDEE